MNKLDKDYQDLIKDILSNGVEKEDRTGTGTISVFGRQIRHNMKKGFPLLTTKKMAIKTMMTELKWFLKGDTNIKYLVDNGCNIWNGDAYKNYLNHTQHEASYTQEEFINYIKTDNDWAKVWGELGPIYGHQWRQWTVEEDTSYDGKYVWVDQIQYLIEQLKENPDSRRLMVSAWNVGELHEMVLPPCHYGFQVYTRELTSYEREDYYAKCNGLSNMERYELHPNHTDEDVHRKMDAEGVPSRAISLMWNQRSVDTPLGLPFNIASYATLLMLLAEEVNMVPDELVGNLGDCHIYKNQVDGCNEQLERQPYKLPTLNLKNVSLLDGEFDYEVVGYVSHPTVKFPLSN